MPVASVHKIVMEGRGGMGGEGREGGREGGREREREGVRGTPHKKWCAQYRKGGGREGGKVGGREGGREGERERGRDGRGGREHNSV